MVYCVWTNKKSRPDGRALVQFLIEIATRLSYWDGHCDTKTDDYCEAVIVASVYQMWKRKSRG